MTPAFYFQSMIAVEDSRFPNTIQYNMNLFSYFQSMTVVEDSIIRNFEELKVNL